MTQITDKHGTAGQGSAGRRDKLVKYFRKLGWVGFFFFLGKGLLWLIIPYLAAKGIINCAG